MKCASTKYAATSSNAKPPSTHFHSRFLRGVLSVFINRRCANQNGAQQSAMSTASSHTSDVTSTIQLVTICDRHRLSFENHSANFFERVDVLERIAFRS